MRAVMRILVFVACAALMPTIALAQAVIAGSVKDSSGAVLPGVNVEATSPELIEKIRTAVTDGTGQYRIEDLRPGAYTVTFSLPGFTTLKREGIELTGTFTATINVELKVGVVAETVTVTGESPVVNIQSARREMTLNNDVLKAIPTVRSYNATVSVVPGVTTNFNDALRAAGLTAPTPLSNVYDLNGSFGGPIKRDKVWYFLNARTQGSTKIIANVYYNQNAGDQTKWLYSPDLSRPAYNDRTSENASGRITWQINTRNKVGVFWDEQANCRTCTGLTTGITDPPRVAPEARGVSQTKPLRVTQVTWSSPLTNKLLLDAGWGGSYYEWGNFDRNPHPTHDLINVVEQCATGCPANGGIPGLVYRSQDWGQNYAGSYNLRAAASYVTGRQSLQGGYQGTHFRDIRTGDTNRQDLT